MRLGRGHRLAPGGYQGRRGGLEPMLLDLRGLAFRPAPQSFEIEAWDAAPKGALEGPPQLALTGDPEIQGLKLEEPAQRRVAPELPVQLQAPRASRPPRLQKF